MQRRTGVQLLREKDEGAKTAKSKGAIIEGTGKGIQGQDQDQSTGKRELAGPGVEGGQMPRNNIQVVRTLVPHTWTHMWTEKGF